MKPFGQEPTGVAPQEWFIKWCQPRAFLLKAHHCMNRFEPDVILATQTARHLRDAYTIGLFGRIWNDHEICEVRLAEHDPPDGHLRSATCALDLEVTLADKHGRKMIDELKTLREETEAGELPRVPISWETAHAHAVEAIPRRCKEKVIRYLEGHLCLLGRHRTTCCFT